MSKQQAHLCPETPEDKVTQPPSEGSVDLLLLAWHLPPSALGFRLCSSSNMCHLLQILLCMVLEGSPSPRKWSNRSLVSEW